MKIGLIDVDQHGKKAKYPNLALMKLSAWHKAQGDDVNWWFGFEHYDRVYMSKIFDETLTEDFPYYVDADEVVKGGSGYGLELYRQLARRKPHGSYGVVYVLVNYDTTMEENLHRIYTLRDMGYDPYVMIYNKPTAPREIRLLQRWCNNRRIFRSVKNFYDYDPTQG